LAPLTTAGARMIDAAVKTINHEIVGNETVKIVGKPTVTPDGTVTGLWIAEPPAEPVAAGYLKTPITWTAAKASGKSYHLVGQSMDTVWADETASFAAFAGIDTQPGLTGLLDELVADTAAEDDSPEPAAADSTVVFDRDNNGHCVPVAPIAAIPTTTKDMKAAIRAIRAAVGNGKVVGNGYTLLAKGDLESWLRSWYSGDLHHCWEIEDAAVVATNPRHPGHPDNPDTHRVQWAAVVAPQTPAGVLPPGDWPDAAGHWSLAEVDNYLIAAQHQHARHLELADRRDWVIAHRAGMKWRVDELSLRAQQRHHQGFMALTGPPQYLHLDDCAELFESATDHPVNLWGKPALIAYAHCHQLPYPTSYSQLRQAVERHLADAKTTAAFTVTFALAADQPTLSGYHRKLVLVDNYGRNWLFKPAPEGKRFRADTEHAAHVLARRWGFRTAESRLIEFDGEYGQAQRMFDERRHLAGYTGADFAALTTAQLCAVAREHVLDWALDNDDSHGENIIITDRGHAVGIDKARAWAYFGAWDGLSGHGSANSNAQLVYTELYTAIKNHHLARDTVDTIYRSVLARARRMQQLPDSVLATIIAAAVKDRPHYHPPSYRQPIPDAPTNAAELIAAATARKNNLVDDITGLWTRVYERAGWQPPAETTALGENHQGHRLHAGLHSPDLHAAVLATKSYGTPAFVAGTDIEDCHVLLWREKGPDGVFRVRGHAKIRQGPAFAAVRNWLIGRAVPVDLTKADNWLIPGEEWWYACIIDNAQTPGSGEHSYKWQWLTGPSGVTEAMATAEKNALASLHHDPTGVHAATLEAVALYRDVYIPALRYQHANKITYVEGSLPRYTYHPHTPPSTDGIRVELRPASRAAASHEPEIRLDDNGDLVLSDQLLTNNAETHLGQPGLMWLTTLPTGEQIEVRGLTCDTNTPLTQQGLLQFTIPDQATITGSLERIAHQLRDMGLDLRPADTLDLELFYWRHLHAVLDERCDTRAGGARTLGRAAAVNAFRAAVDHKAQWSSVRDDEAAMWRAAFAHLAADPQQFTAFLAEERYLPHLPHLDLRNPDQPCGRPYWMRFDVTEPDWADLQMPSCYYRTGPRFIVETGAAMATEARMRTFAIWKSGQSSAEDMVAGSGNFIFTRNNYQNTGKPTVLFHPRIAARTSTYSFNGDQFGKIMNRAAMSPFDFKTMISYSCSGNEMLVKDTIGLLDDIEVLLFPTETQRAKAIAVLAARGVTEIRGVPVVARFIVRGSEATKAAAVAAARAAWDR
jgi:hypothetical protein